MKRLFIQSGLLACLLAQVASPQQTPDLATLSGAYHFVLLEVSGVAGTPTAVQNLSGELMFRADSTYSFNAEQTQGTGPPKPLTGTGSYETDGVGEFRLTSPLSSSAILDAKLGAAGAALIGVDSEAGGATWSLFAAVRKGSESVGLEGDYALAELGFTGATSYHAASILWSQAGGGRIGAVSATGRSRGRPRATENLGEATYALDATGAGTVSFPADAEFLAGGYRLFASDDGAFVIGTSQGPARDILIGIRNDVQSAANFRGRRYWLAELNIAEGVLNAASGALLPDNGAIALLTERLRFGVRSLDFTGMNFFNVSEGLGRGWFASRFLEGVENMGIGAAADDGRARAMVAAQYAPFDRPEAAPADEEAFGIFFAVEAPGFEGGEGPTVDPAGVVNGASFALHPNPITGGSIVSIFGHRFTEPEAVASAAEIPLPLDLLGVSVTVNDVPAPLFFVSPRQINIQAPQNLQGETATIQVHTAGGSSPPVTVRLSPSSPGVFSAITAESFYSGIVIHADGSLVSGNNPAFTGETVVVFTTGLGESTVPVASGESYPADPLPWLADPDVRVYFGGRPGEVLYAGGTPGFVGLQQINVTIPRDAPAGLNVPLAVETDNAFHDQVDIPVLGGAALEAAWPEARSGRPPEIPQRARTTKIR